MGIDSSSNTFYLPGSMVQSQTWCNDIDHLDTTIWICALGSGLTLLQTVDILIELYSLAEQKCVSVVQPQL